MTAYRFWYPTVSAEGIFNGSREAGILDNQSILIAAVGPRAVAFTANSDTPYGAGVLDLSSGPWVIELPPGPFIGLVNDHHQGWILDMGLPGPDAGSAQFETPAGIDLEARDRWFAQAIVTSPAMFRRTAGAGSLYWMSARDSAGAFLDGGQSYKLVLPQPVPGKL